MKQPIKLPEDATPLAREVHRRMLGEDLNQKSLAAKAGLNTTYVRDIFKGKSKNPKSEQIRKIADALGCDIKDLTNPGTPSQPDAPDEVVDKLYKLSTGEWALILLWRILSPTAQRLMMFNITEMIPRDPRSGKAKDI